MTDKPVMPDPEHAFDPAKQDELERAVEQLSPEEATFFLKKLEASLRKRKIQLTGYLVAIFVWLIGMVFALAYYGISDGFVGWVFLVPFGLLGATLYIFGKLADRVGASNGAPAAPAQR